MKLLKLCSFEDENLQLNIKVTLEIKNRLHFRTREKKSVRNDPNIIVLHKI